MEISIPDNTIFLYLKSLTSVGLNIGYFLCTPKESDKQSRVKYWCFLKVSHLLKLNYST